MTETNNEHKVIEAPDFDEQIGLIVHSYNNYLSAMMGFTELTMLDELSDDAKERLALVLSSGDDAVLFGRELLSAMSRIQLASKPIAVAELLTLLQSETSFACEQNLSSLTESLQIKADPEWFTFCLLKITSFINDFGKRDSQIILAISIEDSAVKNADHVVIKISQPGFSMLSTTADKLCEPFFSSRVLLGQKDVGLAATFGYCQQLGGDFCWSAQNNSFIVELPLQNE